MNLFTIGYADNTMTNYILDYFLRHEKYEPRLTNKQRKKIIADVKRRSRRREI